VANIINGTAGADGPNGLSGDNVINGLAGSDKLNGGAGLDTLDGGSGSDTISGNSGNDTLIYVASENAGSADVYDELASVCKAIREQSFWPAGWLAIRQILAVGRPGDVAVGLTTSGNSENVVRALDVATGAGMVTVAMTGEGGGKASATAAMSLRVPTTDTARVQEACLHLGHVICEMVEAALFARP